MARRHPRNGARRAERQVRAADLGHRANTQLTAFYNAIRPEDAANWQLRFQVQFLFPK
jgi:hypothetical protein